MTEQSGRVGAKEEGTRTLWAFLLALTPIVSVVALQPALLGFQQAAATGTGQRVPQHAIDLITVGFVINQAAAVVLIGASGLLARLDHRHLTVRGIVRPFPWGWGFLTGVYLVGRTVVLHRRGTRGAAPLIVGIAVFVAGMLSLSVEFLVIVSALLQHTRTAG